MINVLTFEEKLSEFVKKFRHQLHNIALYYGYLCNSYIKLTELEQKSINLYIECENLKFILQSLYNLNSNNIQLHNITQLFKSTIDFEGKS
jgi:hypothetical protein